MRNMTEEPPVLFFRERERADATPHAIALRRLFEAMCLAATISPAARAAIIMLFHTAAVTAPHGERGDEVASILATLHHRLRARLAVDAPPFDDGPEAA
jgi:hypothetical protein